MITFPQAIHAARTVLANATDAQLTFAGLAARDRDALLAHAVILKDEKRTQEDIDRAKDPAVSEPLHRAAFYPRESYDQKAACISYDPLLIGDDPDSIAECAAHELFHASKFFGSNGWRFQSGLKDAHLTFAMILGGGGIGYGLGFDTLAGIAASYIGSASSCAFLWRRNKMRDKHSYDEEIGAFRFGYLFRQDLYDAQNIMEYDEEMQQKDGKFKKFFKNRPYPTNHKRVDLYNETKYEQMAVGGNALFPDGALSLRAAFSEAMQSFGQADGTTIRHDESVFTARLVRV